MKKIVQTSALLAALILPTTSQALVDRNQAKAMDKGEESKPWRVLGIFEQTLSSGAFVTGGSATPAYGYSLTGIGFYKVHELVELMLRMDASQQLTTTSLDGQTAIGGTIPREFFFQDIRLGALAPSLYTEPTTGIILGLSTDFRLPTSRLSQAFGRVLRWHLNGGGRKTFEGVGPGDLTIMLMEGFRKDFGGFPSVSSDDSASIVNACRTTNLDNAGDCYNTLAPLNYSFVHRLTLTYNFLEDFSAMVDFMVFNQFWHRANDSDLPPSLSGMPVSRSRFANDAINQTDLTWGIIQVGYSINQHFSLALGTSSFQSPFIQKGGNSTGLTFPFWDFATSSQNNSQIYFDVNFSY